MIRTAPTEIRLRETDAQVAELVTRGRERRRAQERRRQREAERGQAANIYSLPPPRTPPLRPLRRSSTSPSSASASGSPSSPRPALRASGGGMPPITTFEEFAAEFRAHPELTDSQSGSGWDASNEASGADTSGQPTDQSTDQSTEQLAELPTHFPGAPTRPPPYVFRPMVSTPISDVRGSPGPRPRFPPLPATPRAPSDFLAPPTVSGLPQPRHQHVMDLPRLSTSAHAVPPTFGAAASQLEHGARGVPLPPPTVPPWATPPSAGGQIPPPPSIPARAPQRQPLFSQSFDWTSESEPEGGNVDGSPPVTPPRPRLGSTRTPNPRTALQPVTPSPRAPRPLRSRSASLSPRDGPADENVPPEDEWDFN